MESPRFPFQEGYPLRLGSTRAHTVLSVAQPRIKRGELFTVDIRLVNESGFERFYNVFWKGLIPLPGALGLYDSNKQYLGDLVRFVAGSRRMVHESDWTHIQEPGYAGTQISARASLDPWNKRLVPGRYYLQVIYFTLKEGGRTPVDENQESFRSNVVTIELI